MKKTTYQCDICGARQLAVSLPSRWEKLQLYSIGRWFIFKYKKPHGQPIDVCPTCNGNGIYNFNQMVRKLVIGLYDRWINGQRSR